MFFNVGWPSCLCGITEEPSCLVHGRDIPGDEMLRQMRPYCPLEIMDSEDPLFVLYTSGSTGKPKVR